MKQMKPSLRTKVTCPSAINGEWKLISKPRLHRQFSPGRLEIRSFVKDEHATAMWQARNEAFRDNWGSYQLTFSEFSYYTLDDAEYDPTLWVVIWDGGDEMLVFHQSISDGYRLDSHVGCPSSMAHQRVRPRAASPILSHLQARDEDHRSRRGCIQCYRCHAALPKGRGCMSTVSEFVTIEKELRAGKTSGSEKN